MESVRSSRSPAEPNFVDAIVILSSCKNRGRGAMIKRMGVHDVGHPWLLPVLEPYHWNTMVIVSCLCNSSRVKA
jgi:hypothetical protein